MKKNTTTSIGRSSSTNIEKLLIDGKSKDEILTAINNAKIKTNKY
jgi:hypothetical protein